MTFGPMNRDSHTCGQSPAGGSNIPPGTRRIGSQCDEAGAEGIDESSSRRRAKSVFRQLVSVERARSGWLKRHFWSDADILAL